MNENDGDEYMEGPKWVESGTPPAPWPDGLYLLSPYALKVYVTMRQKISDAGLAFPGGKALLAKATGLSAPTVLRARDELVGAGLLGPGGAPGYFRLEPRSRVNDVYYNSRVNDVAGGVNDVYPDVGLHNAGETGVDGEEPRTGAGLPRVNDVYPSKEGRARAHIASMAPIVSQRNIEECFEEKPKKRPRVNDVAGGVNDVYLRGEAPGVVAGTSAEDRRAAVSSALKTLGVREGPRLVQEAMRKLCSLLREGFTTEDALQVASWCRREYDAGDRFKKRLNVLYIWGAREFATLLSMASGASGVASGAPGREYRIMQPGAGRDGWDEAYVEKLRRRGLA